MQHQFIYCSVSSSTKSDQVSEGAFLLNAPAELGGFNEKIRLWIVGSSFRRPSANVPETQQHKITGNGMKIGMESRMGQNWEKLHI